MRKCPQCNNTVNENFSFCPSCGYDLRDTNEIPGSAEIDNTEINSEDRLSGNIVLCDVCGEETPADKGECGSCGAILTGKEKHVSAPESEVPVSKTEAPKPAANMEQKKPVQQQKAQPKAKPPVRQGNKQKQKAPAAITPAGNKQAVSPLQIALLVIGLIVIALLILQFTGVFDTSPALVNNAQQQQAMQGDSTGISLDQLNAINAMESEVQKDTTNTERIIQLAHLLNDSGFNEKAIRYYKMYLRSKPGDADAIVDMGVCYFKLKDYITAKAVMRRGLKVNPAHQIANFNLGIINLSAGYPDSAKIWWQKTVDLGPETEIAKKAKQLLNSH